MAVEFAHFLAAAAEAAATSTTGDHHVCVRVCVYIYIHIYLYMHTYTSIFEGRLTTLYISPKQTWKKPKQIETK